jgi:succinoglycan biosynthesis transport protein ExoP
MSTHMPENTPSSPDIALPKLNVAVPPAYPPYPSTQDFEPEASTSVPLSHYIWILQRHLWKMVAFVVVCMIATFVVSARLKPIYEATATINVDMQAPVQVVGQGSTGSSNTADPDFFLATQIKLIQSDAVVRPVAEQFHLLNSGGQKGLSLEQAQKRANAPVSLGGLKVTRPANTYLLLISYRSSDPQMAADVANAVAKSYLEHTYDIRIRSSANLSAFMENQLDELKAKMERSSLALSQFQKEMEVISPEQKTDILSARLLQLNTEFTTAQAERVRNQAAWNAMQSGSVAAAEVSTQGDSITKLADSLNQARQRMAVLKTTYGPNHPEYRKAASEVAELERQFEDARKNVAQRLEVAYQESQGREKMLEKAVNDTKAQWDLLNTRSFEYQQLKQDAGADKTIYDELITKIHDASINAGFKDSNIEIADIARPSLGPVYPDTSRNLELMLLLSILLAVGSAVLLDSLDTTLRDPERAGRFLGTDVIGTLPLDRKGMTILSPAKPIRLGKAHLNGNGNGNGNGSGGDKEDPTDRPYHRISGFEEAMRTVRNTILLADVERRLNSIVITSAEPGEGKTTFSAHFAIANAARGKKTLLVDGDLRRPSVHARFGLNPREGLSSVLNGTMLWQEVVIQVEGRPNLSILPSGPGSHRAADLIGPRLSELLDEFGKEFDLVILDSPPLLGFAECLQMATAADGVLIVSKAGETKRKAVAAVVTALQRIRANIIGVVLNQVSQNTSEDGGSYYGHFRYSNYEAKK